MALKVVSIPLSMDPLIHHSRPMQTENTVAGRKCCLHQVLKLPISLALMTPMVNRVLTSPPNHDLSTNDLEIMDFQETDTSVIQHDTDRSESCNPFSTERTAALFLLSYKEKFKLTQKAIDYAVNSVNTLAESVCNEIRESIRKKFEEQGHSVTVADVTSCCVQWNLP